MSGVSFHSKNADEIKVPADRPSKTPVNQYKSVNTPASRYRRQVQSLNAQCPCNKKNSPDSSDDSWVRNARHTAECPCNKKNSPDSSSSGNSWPRNARGNPALCPCNKNKQPPPPLVLPNNILNDEEEEVPLVQNQSSRFTFYPKNQ
jgi:hypothetical protein